MTSTPRYIGSGDPVRRRTDYYPGWLGILADDVTLEASAMDGAVGYNPHHRGPKTAANGLACRPEVRCGLAARTDRPLRASRDLRLIGLAAGEDGTARADQRRRRDRVDPGGAKHASPKKARR